MTAPLLTLDIRFENDLVSVRQHARQISSLLGFDEMDQARISTAVSEIARNALGYARGGTAEFLVKGGETPELLISVSDKGPGISDLPRVLEGRFTPVGGAGMGIASARRLVDTFAIDSTPGSGTTVVLGKRLAGRHAITPDDVARIGRHLARRAPLDPYEEIRRQNHELVRAMEELRARQEDLVRLNRELEDTNRGVVALYAELDEKAIHLRRADELKTRFLSNMSHEFRTPLNSILALSRLLLDRADGPLSEQQTKQLTFIQQSAQDLSDLVNDLLDIAKVEAGRITVNAAEMDLANLFGGLRGMFRPLLTNNSVNLVFEDPPPAPKICTDEGKVSQILRNFISNALKFTERGEVRVSARAELESGRMVFAVADTGIGIAPEDQDRIFQEFAQVDNPIQRRVRGTGLGLPLAKRLAQLLGGSISLESRPGEGSTFCASLPLVCPGGRIISEAEPRTEPDTTRFPVLIVEDDPEVVALYEKYLKRTGFQPLPAGSFAEARQMLRQILPTAIILDVASAGATWDFLLEMKRDDEMREVPVLVISASDEAQKARALGADEFCLKPVDRSTLLSKLKRLARRAPVETILIVDDDAVSRYLLRELLADTRYEVLEATDGREGIQIARERQPGAILLDLVMPGMSGFEVLDCLAADPATRSLPVIIVTSKILDGEEKQFLGERAVAVVSKGIPSREEAVAALRAALAKAEAASRPSQTEEARNVY